MLGFGNKKQNFNEQNPHGAPGGINNNCAAAPQTQPQNMQQTDPREEEYINAMIEKIDSEVSEFSRKNPAFDMKREMQNPEFCKYVWGNGLSVEDAYILAHKDKLLSEKTMPNSAGSAHNPPAQNRIAENGTGKTAGSGMIKKNPKDLSDEELDDIVKRVRDGEKISF